MIGRATRSMAPVKTPPRKSSESTGPGSPSAYAITITHAPSTVKRITCPGGSLPREGREGGSQELRHAAHRRLPVGCVRHLPDKASADDHPVGDPPHGR